ncbi:MAG: hypothetical protein AB7S81_04760 [Bdellovibrionales bacterium]
MIDSACFEILLKLLEKKMPKYLYPINNEDHFVRLPKFGFFFFGAALVLCGTACKVANLIEPNPHLQELGKVALTLSIPIGLGFLASCMSQTMHMRGNGHGPIRRFLSTVFLPSSYKNGAIPR